MYDKQHDDDMNIIILNKACWFRDEFRLDDVISCEEIED